MIALYIIFGLYYLINLFIFCSISYKKTKNNNLEESNYNKMISLLNDTNSSVAEPLLNDFV
jgi:hypothetical protein